MSGTAIVGMACVFPGAPDLETFRQNVEGGVDAITDVPDGRWDASFYDAASTAVDRFYCRRGGFIDPYARFDALGFGIMPVAAQGAEPDQLLALQTAAAAMADAGFDTRDFPRATTGVILGRGGYMGPGLVRVDQHVRMANQLVSYLRALVPGIDDDRLAEVKADFQSRLGPYGPDTAIGLVPNLVASRIANRLDLKGPAWTVDAACASSLVAVDQAIRELSSGRSDLMIAGGVHLCHDVTLWSVFCQLGALSRSEQIRPFDERADGLLVGEGIGILVLKRFEDAVADGDRVYAVIRGSGLASDGRDASLMQPRVEGQLLALERAWHEAGIDPTTIGLLEAHGTGTPAGDAAELETLRRFFGEVDCALGSVKSMIGHAMPAAGAAGLIKAALAVHHAVLPPTLHCERPKRGLLDSGFRPLAEAEPWEGPVRRAGVDAFGFGGIDAHVVLEAPPPPARTRARSVVPDTRAVLHLYAGDGPEEVLDALEAGRVGDGRGRCRLAVLEPTPAKLERARKIVERGEAWRSGRGGMWYSPRALASRGGKTAFLFPGVDASFAPRVEDVAEAFDRPLPTHLDAEDLEGIGFGIVSVSRLLLAVLEQDLGVKPHVMAGHSIGEWSGMIASGLIPDEEVDPFIRSLVPGRLEVPGVVFAAVACGIELAEEVIEGLPEIAVSHDNCPHQLILCGREDSIDVAIGRLKESGTLCQKLPFRSGFHSPLFEGYLDTYREHMTRLPLTAPRVPLWSATTCAPYPTAPGEVRELAIRHLVEPVRFRELCERLHDEGVRIFVQVGTGSLVGFVGDTLRGRDHTVVSANVPKRSGLDQLGHLAAALWVEGVRVALDRLPLRIPSRGRGVPLELGSRLVTPDAALALPAPAAPLEDPEVDPADPVMAEFATTLREIRHASREVIAAYRDRAAAAPPLEPRSVALTHRLSVDAFPELVDHTFYRQAPGWPHMSDRFPVVPMTTTVATMLELAGELVPERVPVAIERLRAFRWIAVEPPLDLDIRLDFDGVDRVYVELEGYAQATVRLAEAYPPAPEARAFSLTGERPPRQTADTLYEDRWMFHGPAFQAVRELGPMADDGIRGTLESLPTPGALLDNAGQLLGYWVMESTEIDRLAMPVRVDRMAFHGPHPPVGEAMECRVKVTELTEQIVRADIDVLGADGTPWCVIDGWEDRRFDTVPRLWEVLRYPEENAYAEPLDDGYVRVEEAWRSSAALELVSRRFLSAPERAQYESGGLRRQRSFLLGRIAIKDAVRLYLWEQDHGPLFPAQIAVDNDASGRPVVSGPFAQDLRVSVAHKPGVAVAIVGEGQDVGIDVEKIEHRGEDFERISFTDAERALLPLHHRDEWLTRFWVAKEAVAKARGTGLGGNPRRFEVVDVAGGSLTCAGLQVQTEVEGEYVIGWTRAPR